jgi:hypothetical protein
MAFERKAAAIGKAAPTVISDALQSSDRGPFRASRELPSSRRAPFTFLNDSLAGGPGLAALGAHSTFSFGANAETNTPDYDTDTRRGTFLDDPASLRARLLNDVVVGKGGRNDQNRKSGTGQNCSHRTSLLG